MIEHNLDVWLVRLNILQAQMQRKSKFALDDEDDDQAMEVLTHGGSALSTLDDFHDDISADEDDDAGCKVLSG